MVKFIDQRDEAKLVSGRESRGSGTGRRLEG